MLAMIAPDVDKMRNSKADRFSEARRTFYHFSDALLFALALFASVNLLIFVSGSYRPIPQPGSADLGKVFVNRSAINVSLMGPTHSPPLPEISSVVSSPIMKGFSQSNNISSRPPPPLEINTVLSPPVIKDFSCLSRHETKTFLRDSAYLPSLDLVQSLRKYEDLHKSCGPRTQSFEKSALLLRSSSSHGFQSKCRYLVWTPENGLGNQMISLVSSFLYALLSRRVLLIDSGKDLHNLFCEPFPESSWFLPSNFSMKSLFIFNKTHPARLGNFPSAKKTEMVYIHLSHDYEDQDKRFYCETDQNQIQKIPWMALKSDQYFVPALFLNPEYRRRLHQLFPEKEAIFHHLSRYLFLPGNSVYNLIRSHMQAGFPKSRERLGIQLRFHFSPNVSVDLVTRQIINCTVEKGLLPKPNSSSSDGKAVLITSLRPEFLGTLRRIYRNSSLSFYQPSQEGIQQTGQEKHDAKALSEIFLLGTVDKLLTSSWSTFGYAAQGIGGITPWILLFSGPVHSVAPSSSCERDVSMEPCYHYPPDYDCGTGEFMLTRKMLPFIKQCRDTDSGVKLVDLKKKKKKKKKTGL